MGNGPQPAAAPLFAALLLPLCAAALSGGPRFENIAAEAGLRKLADGNGGTVAYARVRRIHASRDGTSEVLWMEWDEAGLCTEEDEAADDGAGRR